MAINPMKMRPLEVVRLLNSTELGFVISQAGMYREMNRLGYRISSGSDGKSVNLVKFIACLADRYFDNTDEATGQSYNEMKEAARARNAALALSGRDIGDLPEIVNPARKENCKRNFRLFCEKYFTETFHLDWSDDHLKAIAKIEQAVLHGGLFALAMPRGTGKSTVAETACLWAMIYGHREFVTLIGATETAALEMLDSIKTELEVNEALLADFPEVVYPIHSLEGISNRCAGQLHKSKRTCISWTANEIVLPTVEGSAASGAIIRVAGITGRIRGMKFKKPGNAKPVRPSLVIIDDPQTSESANSLEQTRKRIRVLAGDVLGLAGPGQKISGIMPCTVIRPGDMADEILNRQLHPDWNGERTKMIYKFPENSALWEKYADIRADSLREHGDLRDATAFYKNNQEPMDAGAIIAWDARFNHDEVSAIQHAMNLKLQDESAFWSEYQNEPLPENLGEEQIMSIDEIATKVNGIGENIIPVGCNHITMFIDVQKPLLFWIITAWEDDFTGYVVNYGVFPEQSRKYFSLKDAHPSLQEHFPNTGLEGCIYSGLEELTAECFGREFHRDDGAMLKVERCMIDANWGQSTDVVYQFCRQSRHAANLLPSHGKYVGASSKPMTEYKKQKGDRIGHNWMIPNVRGKRAIRHVIYDTNYWKSFIHARLAVAMGDKGCLSLFGRHRYTHQQLAEHFTAEYRVKTEGRGRVVDEWKQRPEKPDNHWFDGIVGCAVAASIQGCTLPATDFRQKQIKKPRIKLSELKRNRKKI